MTTLSVVAAFVFAVFAGRADAATITVTSALDKGVGSLRSAIAGATDGDTIVFDASLNGQTILLTSGALSIKSSIDIEGPGAGLLAVSGGDVSQVFALDGEGLAVTIGGLTLTHGRAMGRNGGGAVAVVRNALTLAGDVLSFNQSLYAGTAHFSSGGALSCLSGSLTITNSSFLGNQVVGENGGDALGGAIYVEQSTATIARCTFEGNQSHAGNGGTVTEGTRDLGIAQGGGIVIHPGSIVTIADSTFTGNRAIAGNSADASAAKSGYIVDGCIGGGVSNHGELHLRGSRFSDNQAIGGSGAMAGPSGANSVGTAGGGGLFNGGSAEVSDCTFDHNEVLGGTGNIGGDGFLNLGYAAGGGILNSPTFGSGVLTLDGVALTDNRAVGGARNVGGPFPGDGIGGGLANSSGGRASVLNSTLSGNQALGGSAGDGLGGGSANYFGSTLTIAGSRLDGNQASGATGLGGGSWNDGLSAYPTNAGVAATLSLEGSTITDNDAASSAGPGEGGGVYASPKGVACEDLSTSVFGNAPDNVYGLLSSC
jgi:hypothetical protein